MNTAEGVGRIRESYTNPGLACVASVPVRSERNSGNAKEFSHYGRAKNGARAKRWKEGGGVGERSPLPPPPSFHFFALRLRVSRISFARTGTLATQANPGRSGEFSQAPECLDKATVPTHEKKFL